MQRRHSLSRKIHYQIVVGKDDDALTKLGVTATPTMLPGRYRVSVSRKAGEHEYVGVVKRRDAARWGRADTPFREYKTLKAAVTALIQERFRR